jgi:hypothetical protein
MVAPAPADAGLEGQPMPSPLQWYEAPLTERTELVRRGVPANWLLDSQQAGRACILMRVDGLIHGNPGDL